MFKKKKTKPVLKIKRLSTGAVVPKYMTEGAVAFDLYASEDCVVYNKVVMVPTGISVELPEGHELTIRPRSGLSIEHPNYIANSPGTIDTDYRGEIKILVVNNGHRKKPWEIKRGDRIAQGIVNKVEICEIQEVDNLSETTRNSGGFGHTGR